MGGHALSEGFAGVLFFSVVSLSSCGVGVGLVGGMWVIN
jgi:hypothetical protein